MTNTDSNYANLVTKLLNKNKQQLIYPFESSNNRSSSSSNNNNNTVLKTRNNSTKTTKTPVLKDLKENKDKNLNSEEIILNIIIDETATTTSQESTPSTANNKNIFNRNNKMNENKSSTITASEDFIKPRAATKLFAAPSFSSVNLRKKKKSANDLLAKDTSPSLLDDKSNSNQLESNKSSKLFMLDQNSKRWSSVNTLRDSIRNLTSCVSMKSNFLKSTNRNLAFKSTDSSNSSNTNSFNSININQDYLNNNNLKIITSRSEQVKSYIDPDLIDRFTSSPWSLSVESMKHGNSLSSIEHIDSVVVTTANNNNNNNNNIKSQIEEEVEEEHSKIIEYNNNNNNNLNSVTPLTWFETNNNKILEGNNNNNKKKIIIKKKKNKNTNQYEDTKLNILDMIEKVQSNGFDDQRFSSNNNNKMNKNLILSLNENEFLNQISNRKFDNDKSKSVINTTTTITTTATTPTTTNTNNHNIVKIINMSTTFNSTGNSSDRLSKILIETNTTTNDQMYPMISLPDNDAYWSESYNNENNDLCIISSSTSSSTSSVSPYSTTSSSSASPSLSSNSSSINHSEIKQTTDLHSEQNYYESFIGIDQQLVFFGQDIREMPLILSYKLEQIDSVDYLKAILRTKETNHCLTKQLKMIYQENNNDQLITPFLICKLISNEIRIKCFQPLTILNGFKLIRNFDQHMINKNLKFGVIYMKKGQTTEEELFSNQEHSESFDRFLNILGKRIKLKDFDGFRGGLDTSNGQTGEYSVYESYKNREIMFHVSTLLPFSKSDQQQLERKRHIGNDIVAIVYQEDNTPFAPDMIASNFLHAFIVVQKLANNNKSSSSSSSNKYKISVTARKDVPNFGPPISTDSIYDESDPAFKDWLLNKLINAELACYKAEKFRKLNERTRHALLDALYNDLNDQNQRLIQSLSQQQIDDTYSNFTNESTHSSSRLTEHRHSIDHLTGPSLLFGASNNNLAATNGSTSSSTHSSSSAAFKFSLINTVRKAFKKEGKQLSLMPNSPVNNNNNNTPTNSNKFDFSTEFSSNNSTPTATTTTFIETSNNNLPMHNPVAISRFRSSTFDAGSLTLNNSSKANSIINKQSLEPQQAAQLFSKKPYISNKLDSPTKLDESNATVDNSNFKQKLNYSGSNITTSELNRTKLLSTNPSNIGTNKQKHLNTENSFEIIISDSINNVKEIRPSNFEENISYNSSTTSSSSSSSSSQTNDYSPIKENNFNQTKMKYTNQDLDLLKPKTVNLSARNSDLNSTNESSINQKLNLQQRIQQKRHSLSIK